MTPEQFDDLRRVAASLSHATERLREAHDDAYGVPGELVYEVEDLYIRCEELSRLCDDALRFREVPAP